MPSGHYRMVALITSVKLWLPAEDLGKVKPVDILAEGGKGIH